MADQSNSQHRRGRPKKALPMPSQKATVIKLAEVDQPRASNTSSVDQKIIDRISSCLDRGSHRNTPKIEAETALRMSSRLMSQYNVSQDDVRAAATTAGEFSRMGGHSTVSIVSTKTPSARVIFQAWVSQIAGAMELLFDCSSYSTTCASSIEWTFYGIAANTVPAAMAFEMAHNLTLEWARSKRKDKHSYCMGIGLGLFQIAEEEKQREEEDAERAEARERPTTPSSVVGPPSRECRLPVEGSKGCEQVKMAKDEADWDAEVKMECSGFGYENPDLILEGADGETSDGLGALDLSSDDEEDFKVEPTFKEEDEEPIDLMSDFEDQLRRMIPKQEPMSPDTFAASKNRAEYQSSSARDDIYQNHCGARVRLWFSFVNHLSRLQKNISNDRTSSWPRLRDNEAGGHQITMSTCKVLRIARRLT